MNKSKLGEFITSLSVINKLFILLKFVLWFGFGILSTPTLAEFLTMERLTSESEFKQPSPAYLLRTNLIKTPSQKTFTSAERSLKLIYRSKDKEKIIELLKTIRKKLELNKTRNPEHITDLDVENGLSLYRKSLDEMILEITHFIDGTKPFTNGKEVFKILEKKIKKQHKRFKVKDD